MASAETLEAPMMQQHLIMAEKGLRQNIDELLTVAPENGR
jgi:hypothetical protein